MALPLQPSYSHSIVEAPYHLIYKKQQNPARVMDNKYYFRNFLLFLFVVFIGPATALSICSDSGGNYTDGSRYGDNLNGALLTITASINNTGFNNASFGQKPDTANALLLCRADVSVYACQYCKRKAISELQAACRNRKQAVSWQEYCTLRYSNDSVYGTPAYYIGNARNLSSPDYDRQQLRDLLDDLRDKAANSGDSIKAAGGNATATDFQTVYAMVQCRSDLLSPYPEEDCRICLTSAADGIAQYCGGKIGCSVLRESCFLRYETSPFFNETRIRELMMPTSFQLPPGSNDNKTRTVIISIVISVAVVVFVIFVIIVCIFFRKRTNLRRRLDHVEDNGEISTVESLRYDFSVIRDATNDFSEENKLGQGGFGAVCKGKLSNGQEIAVKRLSKNSGQGELEFKNEVLLLAKLQHRNLVKLLGFALRGAEKLLVYEFVQNASLDKFIFDPVKRSELDWERRRKIIGGIARGILYLHEDSRLRIIHRDLKASNVLLDSEMNPKIADFGMARLFVQNDQTEGSTDRIVGTYGYMAPEYAMHGQFSIKSDVFSFGVLLLEIVTGQKNTCFVNEDETFQDLLSFAWKNWQEGTCANVIDPILKSGSGTSIGEMMRCIHIGLLCVQDKVAVRPTMASVVLMLSSSSMPLALPTEPAFFVQGIGYESSNNAREFDANDTDLSRNEVSITESYPR